MPDDLSAKRRAACDECRHKKLKCTGEQPTCSRCAREGIVCAYSPQKPMGRPKKRQRSLDDDMNHHLGTTIADIRTGGENSDAQKIWGAEKETSGLADSGMESIGYVAAPLTAQPWPSSSSTTEWVAPITNLPSAYAVPGLTPDTSSSSPPMLNIPPELQHTEHRHGSTNTSHGDRTPSIDQSLMGTPCGLSSTMPSCACISSMYLTLHDLSSMDPSFPFPIALYPLREALRTVSDTLICEECPTRFITAIQNTQLIGAVFMSIAERFSRILKSITQEAQRAELANETKKFRLADLNSSHAHLHTGGLGCAAAFSLDLSPAEWRVMSKKVVRAEVHGQSDGSVCCPTLTATLHQMERRQQKWHERVPAGEFSKHCEGPPTGSVGRISDEQLATGGGDHLCLKTVSFSRKMIESFDWT